jgi:hypothetical protein
VTEVLGTIATALRLASRLKTISDRIKEAEFQKLLADLHVELAELKGEVSTLIEENTDLKQQVRTLKGLDAERCPRCSKLTWRLEDSRPDLVFGVLGVTERTYRCGECAFTEKKQG